MLMDRFYLMMPREISLVSVTTGMYPNFCLWHEFYQDTSLRYQSSTDFCRPVAGLGDGGGSIRDPSFVGSVTER